MLSDSIVEAFDAFVAKPLEADLKKLHGRDLAKRNPMNYIARGTDSAEEWADRRRSSSKMIRQISGAGSPGGHGRQ
jgi:hypothetical protein